MKFARFGVSVVGTLSLSAVASAATVYPGNNGFETPNLTGQGYSADPSYVYTPSGAGWTFSGNSGIANNVSAFSVSGAQTFNTNPDGTVGATSTYGQAAFIQYSQYTNSSGTTITSSISTISQDVTLDTGTVSVSFLEEARPGINEGAEDITVSLDGIPIGVFPDTTSATFTPETTAAVVVTAGAHTLNFSGTPDATDPIMVGDDEAQFIDSVSLTNTPVPEPASLTLLSILTLGLLPRPRRT